MITQEQQKQGEELIRTLAQKAWESSTFKEQLVKNPIPTIESATGYKFTENVKVVVEDQTDDSVIFLNIPRKIDTDSIELNDEQLEMVSGGDVICATIVVCCVVVAAGYAFAHATDPRNHH